MDRNEHKTPMKSRGTQAFHAGDAGSNPAGDAKDPGELRDSPGLEGGERTGYVPPSRRSIAVWLTNGTFALIEARDAIVVAGHEWRQDGKYAAAWDGERTIRMHRLVMRANGGEVVDHVNGDGLDNRRENLRIVTVAQNNRNSSSRKGSRSRFKGVSPSRRGKWRASIRHAKKLRNLGDYDTEEAAALAYDAAARELHGEYARCNFGGERE